MTLKETSEQILRDIFWVDSETGDTNAPTGQFKSDLPEATEYQYDREARVHRPTDPTKGHVTWPNGEHSPSIVPSRLQSVYLIGSLRNSAIPAIGKMLRGNGIEVFDDWFAGGPIADDSWKEYEEGRGHNYAEALSGYAADHVFNFDKYHLDRCSAAVLILPAGRSAHLELGYMAGQGKKTYVLMDKPDRWDVMYKFATAVVFSLEGLIKGLKNDL